MTDVIEPLYERDDGDEVVLDTDDYERLVEQDDTDRQHTVSESADKLTLTTKVKRGTGTRDQDEVKVKCKGDDPEATVEKLAMTLAELRGQGVADDLRNTQPEVSDK